MNARKGPLSAALTALGVSDLEHLAHKLEDAVDGDTRLWIDGAEFSIEIWVGGDQIATQVPIAEDMSSFWPAVFELEDEVLTCLSYASLAEDIESVEGFPVSLAGPDRGDHDLEDWPYQRAAPGTWTLARWASTRLLRHYPALMPLVLRQDGCRVHGTTRLATVRQLSRDGLLLETQFRGSDWLPRRRGRSR